MLSIFTPKLRKIKSIRCKPIRVFSGNANKQTKFRSRFLKRENTTTVDIKKITSEINERRMKLKEDIENFRNEMRRFNSWRQHHALKFLVAGGIIGALSLSSCGYWYVTSHPEIIDSFVSMITKAEFQRAKSYEERKEIYFSLPEPDVPTAALEEQILAQIAGSWNDDNSENRNSSTTSDNSAVLDEVVLMWAKIVCESFEKIKSSHLLSTKSWMRQQLLDEIISDDDMTLNKKLNELRFILPASIERDVNVQTLFADYLERGEWLSSITLESSPPTLDANISEVTSLITRTAITFFPGAVSNLILLLDDKLSIEDVTDILCANSMALRQSNDNPDSSHDARDFEIIRDALSHIKEVYEKLSPSLQTHVLSSAIATTISLLPQLGGPMVDNEYTSDMNQFKMNCSKEQQLSSPNSAEDKKNTAEETMATTTTRLTPYNIYVNAIHRDLLGPLRRDARISESVLNQVKAVFLNLPSDIQARILLTAIQHPNSRGEVDGNAQASMVRDLLSAGGVVAVKLAQVIAEDPRVPENYRLMLGSLRDTNEAMSPSEVWFSLPPAIRSKITHLGPVLGVGSVKQVNLARFVDGKNAAVAILRTNVSNEALASLLALQSSEDLEPVATRLGRLVYGEFDLFGEGEALGDFASTAIGTHPLFHVVKVYHHSPKCLIEEVAEGVTVAKALKDVTKDSERSAEVNKTLETLVEFHRTVIKAFVNDGLIHSDIHLGNMTQNIEEDGSVRFTLYDVGQFEHIGPADTIALLWAMSWLSTKERRVRLKDISLRQLVSVSTMKEERILDHHNDNDGEVTTATTSSQDDKANITSMTTNVRNVEEEMSRRLFSAFEDAVAPYPDGSEKDKKTAWILFLRNSERNGVCLPQGAFALAKMMDSIMSQQVSYGLPEVLNEAVETFLRTHMTWGETISFMSKLIVPTPVPKTNLAVQSTK